MDEELVVVPLTLENGTQVNCYVIAVFDVLDKEYIALLPVEEHQDELLLFRYKTLADDEIELQNIDDEVEFERVVEFFDELMEQGE